MEAHTTHELAADGDGDGDGVGGVRASATEPLAAMDLDKATGVEGVVEGVEEDPAGEGFHDSEAIGTGKTTGQDSLLQGFHDSEALGEDRGWDEGEADAWWEEETGMEGAQELQNLDRTGDSVEEVTVTVTLYLVLSLLLSPRIPASLAAHR